MCWKLKILIFFLFENQVDLGGFSSSATYKFIAEQKWDFIVEYVSDMLSWDFLLEYVCLVRILSQVTRKRTLEYIGAVRKIRRTKTS